jgi:hypothetical protein
MSPPTAALWEALGEALASFSGQRRSVVRCERRPSAYRSSFPIEELMVHLDDGTTLAVNREALTEDALRAKPDFLYDPLREIEVYRALLADARLGTAVCYGAVADSKSGRYWLFLEKVPGVELYQVGDFAVWLGAARWLAGLHGGFAHHVHRLPLDVRGHLLRYDRALYRRWIERALAFTRRPTLAADDHGFVERLAARYDSVIDCLASLPATLLHGEFYPANILIQGPRICPVDWETAALGPGLIDLAALTAGRWTEAQRLALAKSYREALPANLISPPDFESLLAQLDHCRLHLAVQWLGWSADWSPPPHQAHDWLGEARRLAGKLGLTSDNHRNLGEDS